jgi:hypothetical protein
MVSSSIRNRPGSLLIRPRLSLLSGRWWKKDLRKAGEINEAISNVTKTLENVTSLIDEVRASLEESELGFEDYQAKYRAKVRKEVVGKNLDLSATKGEGFKEVRVLSVNPVEIRIYQSSGPSISSHQRDSEKGQGNASNERGGSRSSSCSTER